jgi:hypothetical protein
MALVQIEAIRTLALCFSVANPSANRLDWSLRVRRELTVSLVLTSSQTLSPPVSCLVQKGEDIVYLGGTSKAYTVAQEVDDGDGSFVIEDAAKTACRCPTPHQPIFIATNSINVYSYVPSLSARTLASSWTWRSGTKRLCKNGRALRARTRRVLATASGCSTRTARRAYRGGCLDHRLRE